MCPKTRLIQASRVRSMPTFVSFIFSNHSLKYYSNHLPYCSCRSVICDVIFCEVQSKTKYNCLKRKKNKNHLTGIYFPLLACVKTADWEMLSTTACQKVTWKKCCLNILNFKNQSKSYGLPKPKTFVAILQKGNLEVVLTEGITMCQ